MLNFYRSMIGFRKAYPALLKGEYKLVEAEDGYLSFIRRQGNVEVFCAFNLSPEPRDVKLPDGAWQLDRAAPFTIEETETGPRLPGWQALFATTGS